MASILLYLDPGSGSYLVQVIIAGVLGVLFYFKNMWRRIRAFFRKPDEEEDTAPGNETPND